MIFSWFTAIWGQLLNERIFLKFLKMSKNVWVFGWAVKLSKLVFHINTVNSTKTHSHWHIIKATQTEIKFLNLSHHRCQFNFAHKFDNYISLFLAKLKYKLLTDRQTVTMNCSQVNSLMTLQLINLKQKISLLNDSRF